METEDQFRLEVDPEGRTYSRAGEDVAAFAVFGSSRSDEFPLWYACCNLQRPDSCFAKPRLNAVPSPSVTLC